MMGSGEWYCRITHTYRSMSITGKGQVGDNKGTSEQASFKQTSVITVGIANGTCQKHSVMAVCASTYREAREVLGVDELP